MSTNPSSSPLDRSPSTEKGATDSLSELPVDNQGESKTRERDTHEEEQPTQNKDEEDDTSPSKTQDAEENTTGPHDDRENAPEEDASAPPLPDEPLPPPLPNEAPPDEDDGWEPVWDAAAQAYYFYNRFTGISQWENPRVPDAPSAPALAPASAPVRLGDAAEGAKEKSPVVGGYNPAIHGDYDPTAPYAQQHEEPTLGGAGVDPSGSYEAVGTFNRFTGRWQPATVTPENYNDENKSRRQMNAFFDVDAAANAHDGRSLRAERSARKLTKKELKMFKEKRREKKEEKRRAWLRD